MPGDGNVAALRALLNQLDGAAIEVEGLSIHTPDLDDVFFALTGQPDDSARPTENAEGDPVMSTMSYAAADSATMLRRSLRHMIRYPSMTLLLAFMPIVLLLIFVYVFGGTLGSGLGRVPGGGGRAAYISYVLPGVIVLSIACVVAGDRDLGGDGHDHRHHRPVPHHGHLPLLGADRARARHPDPGAVHHRRWSSASGWRSASGRTPSPGPGWPSSASC